jgi:uncharacterized protein (TIGR03000 family)
MKIRILAAVGFTCLAWLTLADPALAQRRGYGYGGYGYGGYGYGGFNNYGRVNVFYSPGAGVSLGYGLGNGLTYYPWGSPNYGSYSYSFPARGYAPAYAPAYAGGFSVPEYRANVNVPAFADPAGQSASGFSGNAGAGSGTSQSFYAGPMPTAPGTASVRVLVPAADAQVLFDGTPTKQQGTDRAFVTPPLPAGRECHYTITATWTENGKQLQGERRITVTPGAQVEVNFRGASN